MPVNEGSNWNQHWAIVGRFGSLYEKVQQQQSDMYVRLLLGKKLGKNSKILEIGGGTGGLSTRLARHFGSSGTIVDNSVEAKRYFDAHFSKSGIHYRLMDAFDLKDKEKFDVVFSDGLIEHFVKDVQKDLIRAHVQAAKKDGCIILVVPKTSWRYAIFSNVMKITGFWNFGFERPYSLQELTALCEKNGLVVEKDDESMWEVAVRCRKK